jgi:hypothetical protein
MAVFLEADIVGTLLVLIKMENRHADSLNQLKVAMYAHSI